MKQMQPSLLVVTLEKVLNATFRWLCDRQVATAILSTITATGF